MTAIGDIPEIQGLDRRCHLIRIARECDVPLTPRVQQLIDTPEFRRLGAHSASWDWCRWFTLPLTIRDLSTRWASTVSHYST